MNFDSSPEPALSSVTIRPAERTRAHPSNHLSVSVLSVAVLMCLQLCLFSKTDSYPSAWGFLFVLTLCQYSTHSITDLSFNPSFILFVSSVSIAAMPKVIAKASLLIDIKKLLPSQIKKQIFWWFVFIFMLCFTIFFLIWWKYWKTKF